MIDRNPYRAIRMDAGLAFTWETIGATAGEAKEGKVVPNLEQTYLFWVANQVFGLELRWQQL